MSKSQFIEDMTEEYYPTANEGTRELIEEYLDNATDVTYMSLNQYKSALRIFAAYINRYCGNKHITEVTSLDFLKYQNWLLKQGLFTAAIRAKRSAVSNLNNNIILFHGDEYPTFRNFITKAVKIPQTGKRNVKEPITDFEYDELCKYLEEKQSWQKLAYVKFSYISGARRNEVRFLLKEVVDYKPISKMIRVTDDDGKEIRVPIKKYKTNLIKCKGSKEDPMRRLSFVEDTLDSFNQWLEVRGKDDCPYMFITYRQGVAYQVAENTFNQWCEEFSKVLGRRIYPHLFRSSRATSLFLSGKSLQSIQSLLGHKSIETTKIYIVKNDEDEEDEIFAE